MRPRLQPFGTDFGNGDLDRHYFQRDRLEDEYRARTRGGPRERFRVAEGSAREDAAHAAVLDWSTTTLANERPDVTLPDAGASVRERYVAIRDAVQEDFVVQLRDEDGGDRAIAVFVCFPSHWRPEGILGWSFQRIHAAVPEFADESAAAESLATAMIERGPYVRFVWTVVAHAELDHHPEDGPGTRFEAGAREGWLRVERQVTVPLPEQHASLFLIRTYLTPFAELDTSERDVLAAAIRCMPEASARYKGIEERREFILGALQRA
jgi:hypothetical protein